VQRDRHRFSDPLPQFRQTAQVRRTQGRGAVRIVGQPNAGNNFTLSVLVEDQLAGRGSYSIAFYWQVSSRDSGLGGPTRRPDSDPRTRPSRRANRGEERLTWVGQVDDEVVVECRGNDCRSQTVRGSSPRGDRFYFSRPIPDSEIRVSLDDVEGRGDVQLVEHPTPHNDFTAKVRIRDQLGGAGDYSFSLFWMSPSRSEPERLFARPGLMWSGRVDGVVRVVVQASSAVSQVVIGNQLEGERVNFVRALPRELLPNAAVKKVRGRGNVEIVEFPTSSNGWRLVFEVNDGSGGADNYEIEVGW
jgi:hypothetical protein